MKRLVWLVLCAACRAEGVGFAPDASDDGASDAAKDATTDAAEDATTDAENDAPSDVATDVPTDALTDASSDATKDAASDAIADADAGDAGSSWHSPTCDGTIGSGEYGGAQNQATSASQTWYMTWDATNLYVALDNATLSEGSVLYVGFTGNGRTGTQVYDGTGGTLPFPADGAVYAKDGYQEVRIGLADAGAWGNPATNAITYCSSGTTREEVIPWTALGASAIPYGFRFLAYATSISGFVYGQIPTTNAGGSIGTSYVFPHDQYVASTANGSGSFPFADVE